MWPRRSTASVSSVQMGSSNRLPLVATTAKPSSRQQQAMQGRIGQHDAQGGIARRYGIGEWRRVVAPAAKHDGASAEQQQPFFSSETRHSRDRSSEGAISANGFSSRCLRCAQPRDAAVRAASTIR